jgi:hypothetical protein
METSMGSVAVAADILRQFADEERRKLANERVAHGPTVGAIYEGLTRTMSEKTFLPELGLRMVEGFAAFEGARSGQIDCMLARARVQDSTHQFL